MESKNVKIHLNMKILAKGLGYNHLKAHRWSSILNENIEPIPLRYDKLFQRRNHLHRMGEKFIQKALLKKHENNAEN